MKRQEIDEAIKMIANFIINRRKDLGMTQVELAERAGLGIATIKRLELQKYGPDFKSLMKICSALNCYFFFASKDSDEPIVKAMRERWQRPDMNN